MKTRQSIKSIFLLLASALLLTAAGCGKAEGAGTADDKLSLREQGIAYMGAGDYQNAELSFIKALSTSNGIVKQVDLDISYYLGVCEYKLGKPDEAIDTFSAIIGIDDGQEDAYYMRGKVELAKGDKQRAFEDYDRALELEPSRYVLYQKIYMDLCDAGYESEAGSYIGKAVSANEKMSDYQHGIFSYYLGNYDEARNYLEKARNEKKEDSRLIIYLGRCYNALGDSDYAATLYQSWLDSNGDDAFIYNELGLIRLGLSDPEGALSAFASGLETEDPDADQCLRFNEIVDYERAGEFARARSRMEEYLKVYPSDKTAAREYEFLKTR